jgi:hypothetical protein
MEWNPDNMSPVTIVNKKAIGNQYQNLVQDKEPDISTSEIIQQNIKDTDNFIKEIQGNLNQMEAKMSRCI